MKSIDLFSDKEYFTEYGRIDTLVAYNFIVGSGISGQVFNQIPANLTELSLLGSIGDDTW